MPTTILGLLGHLVLYGQRMLVYPHGFLEKPEVEVYEPSAFDIPFQDLRLTTPDGVTIACHLMLFEEFYKEFCQYKASAPPQHRKKRKRKMSEARSTSGRSKRKDGPSVSSSNAASTVDIVEAARMNEEATAGPQGRATVTMFHGNAMNHGDLIDLAVQFLIMGCNVLTVSYRGYGNSTGKPSEGGLRIDSQTVLDYLTTHPTLSHVPIIVYGQSLGGAVAIDLVSRNCSSTSSSSPSKSRPTSTISTASTIPSPFPASPMTPFPPQAPNPGSSTPPFDPRITALILENTFLSIPHLVRGWPQPLSSFSFLCTQRWPSQSRIRKIDGRVRVLMLSGENDAVVPRGHMAGLWAAAQTRVVPVERVERRGVDDDGEPGCSSSILCGLGSRKKWEGSEEEKGSGPNGEGAGSASQKERKAARMEVERRVLSETSALQAPASTHSETGDVFRLFEGTGHEDTYLADTYWVEIRAFVDSLGLAPQVDDPEFHAVFTNGMFGSETIFARR